ncbi:hypothetical protein ABTL88_18990, partial [Acinetobacter baumannii]
HVFWLGAGMTLLFLPLVLLFLPEPVSALLQRRRPDALHQVNRSLVALGHPAIAALPAPEPEGQRPALAGLFTRGTASVTILLTVVYFSQLLT